MDIAIILTRKYSGKEWTLDGDSYAGLTWLSEGDAPTEEELAKLWPAVQKEIRAEEKARVDRKASVIEKLGALGLTPDEVADVFGLEVQK